VIELAVEHMFAVQLELKTTKLPETVPGLRLTTPPSTRRKRQDKERDDNQEIQGILGETSEEWHQVCQIEHAVAT
jgi:hypothetical protein